MKRRGRPKCSTEYDKELGKPVHVPENYKGSPWAYHWRKDLIDLGEEGHHVIKEINDKRSKYMKHHIWAMGDLSLMEKPFIVAFTGRNWKCPKEEREIGKKIVTRMSEFGILPIHGNDSGTERASGRYLREQHGSQILVPYYGLIEFKNQYGSKMCWSIAQGHTLVLSIFAIFEHWKLRNVEKRNIFISELADAMIAVQLTDENAGGHLAFQMLAKGKPVYIMSAEGRPQYCQDDHEIFKKKGAIEFREHELDYILRTIKGSLSE